jgi:hypothetical protein
LQAGQCPAKVHTLCPPGATPGPATNGAPAHERRVDAREMPLPQLVIRLTNRSHIVFHVSPCRLSQLRQNLRPLRFQFRDPAHSLRRATGEKKNAEISFFIEFRQNGESEKNR